MSRSLVMAIDGSTNSKEALEWYVKNFRIPGDIVHIVNVTSAVHCPLAMSPLGAEPVVIMNYQEWKTKLKSIIDHSEAILQKAKAVLDNAGIPCKMHMRHHTGNTGEEICQMAERVHANCIIIGSRGLGSLRRTLIGSTSDYVLHHASCPILIVKQYHK